MEGGVASGGSPRCAGPELALGWGTRAAVLLVLLLAAALAAEAQGYWAANVPNSLELEDDATVTLVNRGGAPETVQVYDSSGLVATLTVPPLGSNTFGLENQLYETTITDLGTYYFDTTENVVATLHAPMELMPSGGRLNDATRLLAEDLLGLEYRAVSYNADPRRDERQGDFITVVATQDGTRVEVEVTAPTQSSGGLFPVVPAMDPGHTYVFTLDRFEALNIRSVQGTNDELTGSLVRADRPVAVFSGNERTGIEPPWTTGQADNLVQQMPPVPLAGREFVLCTTLDVRTGGFDWVRVVATEPGITTFSLSNGPTYTIPGGAGSWVEFATTSSFALTSDRPVQVAQYFGRSSNQQIGDAAMVLLSPTDHHVSRSSFHLPAAGGWQQQHVAVAARMGTVLELDGSELGWTWNGIAGSSYGCATRSLPAGGTHHLRAGSPASTWVLGLASPASYWFLANDLPSAPRLGLVWNPDPVCHNHPVTLVAVLLFHDASAPIQWDLGDGTTFTQPASESVVHAWTTPGNRTVYVSMTDAWGRSAAAAETVEVVNCPPVLDPIPDPTVYETETVALRITGSDPNDDPIRFGMMGWTLPSTVHFDPATGSFTWQTQLGQEGTYPVLFWVQDIPYGVRVGQSVTITVLPMPDDPPPTSTDSSGDAAPDHVSGCPDRHQDPSAADPCNPGAEPEAEGPGDEAVQEPPDAGPDPCLDAPDLRPAGVRFAAPRDDGAHAGLQWDAPACPVAGYLVWLDLEGTLDLKAAVWPEDDAGPSLDLWGLPGIDVHRYHVQALPVGQEEVRVHVDGLSAPSPLLVPCRDLTPAPQACLSPGEEGEPDREAADPQARQEGTLLAPGAWGGLLLALLLLLAVAAGSAAVMWRRRGGPGDKE